MRAKTDMHALTDNEAAQVFSLHILLAKGRAFEKMENETHSLPKPYLRNKRYTTVKHIWQARQKISTAQNFHTCNYSSLNISTYPHLHKTGLVPIRRKHIQGK